MTNPRATLLGLATSILLVGCAAGHAEYGTTQRAIQRMEGLEIAVTNNNWMDMTVYVVRSGARMRVGAVTGMTSKLFHLPKSLIAEGGEMRLMADPMGSQQGYTTAPILTGPGTRVEWYLENNLALSSYRIGGVH